VRYLVDRLLLSLRLFSIPDGYKGTFFAGLRKGEDENKKNKRSILNSIFVE